MGQIKITKEQYEFALNRMEELLPVVNDQMAVTDPRVVELTLVSDIVLAYETEHYPIGVPSLSDLLKLSLEEKGMTQRELAGCVGISPSRVNDYVAGRSEPTLRIARTLCKVLGIPANAMLQV